MKEAGVGNRLSGSGTVAVADAAVDVAEAPVTPPSWPFPQEEEQDVGRIPHVKCIREDGDIHPPFWRKLHTLAPRGVCVPSRPSLPDFVSLANPYKYGHAKDSEPPVRFPLASHRKFCLSNPRAYIAVTLAHGVRRLRKRM